MATSFLALISCNHLMRSSLTYGVFNSMLLPASLSYCGWSGLCNACPPFMTRPGSNKQVRVTCPVPPPFLASSDHLLHSVVVEFPSRYQLTDSNPYRQCRAESRPVQKTAVSLFTGLRRTAGLPASQMSPVKHNCQARQLGIHTRCTLQGSSASVEVSGVQARVQDNVNEPEGEVESKRPNEKLIIYSKPGCCLCDGLKEKIEAMFLMADKGSLEGVELEVRDITTRKEWFEAYQYEIPVMTRLLAGGQEIAIARQSPRVSMDRLTKHLQAAFSS